MNYVYDILLNFRKDFIDFFEWNVEDSIMHIRKIPIFKISNKAFHDLKNGEIKINDELLTKIFNRTEIFKGRTKKTIKYSCLIGTDTDVMSILIENNKIILKSDLLIDEKYEIIEILNELNITDFSYDKLGNYDIDFRTRKEKEKINYILKNLSKTDNNKLKYLYYDCFNVKEDDVLCIKKKFTSMIKENHMSVINKIYDFYMLFSYNTK